MKNFRTIALCVTIPLFSLYSSAQTTSIPINEPNLNKPTMFQSMPDNIPVNFDNVTSLFSAEVGRTVTVNLSDIVSFRFDGQVVSSVSKYNNTIQSVVVRSTNLNGANLTISRITDENGNISYTGRILSMQHGDLFELKNINNQLVMVKRKFNEVVTE